jgi:hypothetical protein
MRAIEAVIHWTPNDVTGRDHPTAGRIEVFTKPQPPERITGFEKSVGAYDRNWQETDDVGRRRLMQRYFYQMIHRDKMSEEVVRAKLKEIDDFAHIDFSLTDPARDAPPFYPGGGTISV